MSRRNLPRCIGPRACGGWVQFVAMTATAAANNNAAKKANAARPVGAANPGVDAARLDDPLYAEAVRIAEGGHIAKYGVGWQSNSDFGVIRQHVEQGYRELLKDRQTLSPVEFEAKRGLIPGVVEPVSADALLPKSEQGKALLMAGVAAGLAYFTMK